MNEDKVTIGLTESSKRVSELLVKDYEWFNEGIDAAKFALALAIRQGLEPNTIEGAGTVWNVGSFDTSGDLRSLIHTLFPEIDSPVRCVEYFINAGFDIVKDYLDENPHATIVDLARSDSI
jgi:hypothetical protein